MGSKGRCVGEGQGWGGGRCVLGGPGRGMVQQAMLHLFDNDSAY